ncbi:MAG: 3'-5' exonuclease domain-containing protein 2 [Bacteroidales bacterium]|nr:3'-5' exonuclease domain-containing protein 2 [Bacteroidales bacterium]
MTFKENIDKTELVNYPVSGFQGDIILVDNYKKLKKSIEILKSSDILGFDTETKPSFRKGKVNRVALMQLSNGIHSFIFRINIIGLHDELIDILSDKSIVKAGVAIHDDIKGLKNIRDFEEKGFVELQDYVKEFGIKSSGLRKLSAIILGFRISKRQQVSNWEAHELNDAQLLYAATDAWVCYEIYKKLNKHSPAVQ